MHADVIVPVIALAAAIVTFVMVELGNRRVKRDMDEMAAQMWAARGKEGKTDE